ncbi:MAG: hypothetical protein ACOX6N_02255 [Patescibacteria group bacterium]
MIKYLVLNRWPIFTLSFLIILLIFVSSVPPSGITAYLIFFFLLFSFFLSFTFIFTRRIKTNILIAFFLLSVTLMFFFNLDNLVNIFLLAALFVALYFLSK